MFISTAPRTLESAVNGEDRIHDAKQALGQVVLHGSVAEITAATSAVGHLMSLSPAKTQRRRCVRDLRDAQYLLRGSRDSERF